MPFSRNTIKESPEFWGMIKLKCPVTLCPITEQFIETDRTKDDDGSAKMRRLRYLRLCHEAGRHN